MLRGSLVGASVVRWVCRCRGWEERAVSILIRASARSDDGDMVVRNAWIRTISTVAVTGIAAAGFAGVAASGTSASARTNGRIAWKSFVRVEGVWSIYAANPDG